VHDAAKLSSGHHHVCVLSHDAQVSCWGEPYSPSLGPDTFGSEEPVPFALPDEVIVDVSASMEQVCAVGDSGRVWCRGWLGFRNHELADRSGNPVEIPMPIRAVRVEAGWSGACAWDAQGEAWCWAGLIDGQWPTRVEIGAVADMSYGYHEICALLEDDGRVWCAESPPDALEGQGGFTHIGVSDALSCAVHRTGNVACWGREGLTWTALAGAL
jgi:alpha-tubulin suppressor-like RCC1 family protein